MAELKKNTVDIFDMSGSTPTLGEVPADQVQAAIESGQYALPINKPVPVFNPDGDLGEIPGEQAAEAFKQGFKFATPEQQQFANRPVAAAALGAASTLTAGLAPTALGKLSEMGATALPSREELNKLEEYNPGAYTAGSVAGIAGSLLTGTGIARGAVAAGEAAAAGIQTATAAGRVGSLATKAAVENMVFAGSDELAKVFMGKPGQSVESAIANVGLAGAIGGGLGGAFGAVPELWKMGPGRAVESTLNGIKLATEGKPSAELAKLGIAAAPEVEVALSNSPAAQAAFQGLMQADTTSARALKQSVEAFDDSLADSATRVLGRTADDVAQVSSAKAGDAVKTSIDDVISKRYEPIAKSYDDIEAKFGTAVLAPEARDVANNKLVQLISDKGLLKSKAAAPLLKIVQEAIDDLPKQANAQDLRLLAQNLKASNPFMTPGHEIADKVVTIINDAKDSALSIAADGAGAGELFRATQGQYHQLRKTLESLSKYLGSGKVYGTESYLTKLKNLDPEKISNALSKERVNLTALLEQNFPDVAAKVKQFQYDNLLGSARKGDRIDVKTLIKKIEALEPETQANLFTKEQMSQLRSIQGLKDRLPKNINPSGTAKAIENLTSLPASGIAAAVLGSASGPVAAILGAVAPSLLKEGRDAIKLATLRFLASDAPTSAAAFKQAIGMAKAVSKGQQAFNSATKAVFEPKNGTAVKAPDTTKLRELVEEFTQDEGKMLNVGADLGHYLPDQAAALGSTVVRNIRYLAAQRPSTAPLSPLDGMRKVSDTEEAKYDRALQIAEQPLLILDGVKQGRLTVQDLQHLHQMYPELAAAMATKLQTEMIEHKGNIPYKTQLGLSAFLGMPLSTSMQPQAIQSAQPMQVSMPAPKNGTVRKTPGLPKLAPAYQTPSQTRQTRQQRQ